MNSPKNNNDHFFSSDFIKHELASAQITDCSYHLPKRHRTYCVIVVVVVKCSCLYI